MYVLQMRHNKSAPRIAKIWHYCRKRPWYSRLVSDSLRRESLALTSVLPKPNVRISGFFPLSHQIVNRFLIPSCQELFSCKKPRWCGLFAISGIHARTADPCILIKFYEELALKRHSCASRFKATRTRIMIIHTRLGLTHTREKLNRKRVDILTINKWSAKITTA